MIDDIDISYAMRRAREKEKTEDVGGIWRHNKNLSGLAYPFVIVDTAKAHASVVGRVSRLPSFLANVLVNG